MELVRKVQKNKRNNQHSITIPSKFFKNKKKVDAVKVDIKEWFG